MSNVAPLRINQQVLAKKAKRLMRAKPELNLHQAQHEIALQLGYKSYDHAIKSLNKQIVLPESSAFIHLAEFPLDKEALAHAISSAQDVLSERMHQCRAERHSALENQLATAWDLLNAMSRSAGLPSVQPRVRGIMTMLSVEDPDANITFSFECLEQSEVKEGHGDICTYESVRDLLHDSNQEDVLLGMMLHVAAEWAKTPSGKEVARRRHGLTTIDLARNQEDPYLIEIMRRCGFVVCEFRPSFGDYELSYRWIPETHLLGHDLWDRMYIPF